MDNMYPLPWGVTLPLPPPHSHPHPHQPRLTNRQVACGHGNEDFSKYLVSSAKTGSCRCRCHSGFAGSASPLKARNGPDRVRPTTTSECRVQSETEEPVYQSRQDSLHRDAVLPRVPRSICPFAHPRLGDPSRDLPYSIPNPATPPSDWRSRALQLETNPGLDVCWSDMVCAGECVWPAQIWG